MAYNKNAAKIQLFFEISKEITENQKNCVAKQREP
jgi:hypothetical protein